MLEEKKEFASKGVAGTGLGLAIGALGVEMLNGGFANLFGGMGRNGCGTGWNNGCGGNVWSDKEVFLLRENDRTKAMVDVLMAVTPYQIQAATCDMVKAQKFVPANDIVFTTNSCGNTYQNGCGC